MFFLVSEVAIKLGGYIIIITGVCLFVHRMSQKVTERFEEHFIVGVDIGPSQKFCLY